MSLDFDTLRAANTRRLPQFKNSKGGPAHTSEDGSDWSPAQWLQAVVGELGEFAEVRLSYEAGELSFDEYKVKAAKELADVATYLDILARRALDTLVTYTVEDRAYQGSPVEDSPAQSLMTLLAVLGGYANDRKKLERGDYTRKEFELKTGPTLRHQLEWQLHHLFDPAHTGRMPHVGDCVVQAHAAGVDLGQAVVDKFNEVSKRVGANTFLGRYTHYGQGSYTICNESFYEANK